MKHKHGKIFTKINLKFSSGITLGSQPQYKNFPSRLATMLESVNKQNFSEGYYKIYFILLLVISCCKVDYSECYLQKASRCEDMGEIVPFITIIFSVITIKWFKSPNSCFLHPLNQLKVANQQQKNSYQSCVVQLP